MISEIGLVIINIGLVLHVYISLFNQDIFFDPVRILVFLELRLTQTFWEPLHPPLRY